MTPRAILILILASSRAFCESPSIEFAVSQITHGPKQHFFGYIGQCRTIPWSGDGRYILSMEVDFHDRMPRADDAADILLIDTRNGNKIEKIDRTLAWNFQQGTMFYWHPRAAKTQFFFNDRDPKTGKVFTVLYDIEKRKRVREYRFDDTPIGNGGVAQDGSAFLGLNYGRLARLRPVTGYPEVPDWSKESDTPSNDGMFRVAIETGKKHVIVSYKQLADRLRKHGVDVSDTALFINHTLWNRETDRIYFFVRGGWSGRKGKKVNTPCSVRPDGTELELHDKFVGGHPEWAEGDLLIGRSGKKQVLYDVRKKTVVGQLGTPEIFPKPEGDVSLSPNGKWFVNGWKTDDGTCYAVYRRADKLSARTQKFERGKYSGDLRIDPAPRWNRSGDAILVPGIAKDGTRQLFVIRVSVRE
jgi:hypothetical protein